MGLGDWAFPSWAWETGLSPHGLLKPQTPISSGVPSPTTQLLILPKQFTNWGLSKQIYVPIGTILIKITIIFNKIFIES